MIPDSDQEYQIDSPQPLDAHSNPVSDDSGATATHLRTIAYNPHSESIFTNLASFQDNCFPHNITEMSSVARFGSQCEYLVIPSQCGLHVFFTIFNQL